jgi:hypothetical protein
MPSRIYARQDMLVSNVNAESVAEVAEQIHPGGIAARRS